MKFFGRVRRPRGPAGAKAEFRGVTREVRTPDGKREFRRGVEAKMEDAAIYSDTMDVYMDRVISLNKDVGKPKADPQSRRAARARRPDRHARLPGQDLDEDGKVRYAGRQHHQPEALPRHDGRPGEAADPEHPRDLRQADRRVRMPRARGRPISTSGR